MNNHIDRHGLLPKKTADGRRWIRVFAQKPALPDYEKTSISHKDPRPGCCGFNHAPYASNIEYQDSSTQHRSRVDSGQAEYVVWTTIAHLTSGAHACGFCHVLWLGLQQYRQWWQAEWKRLKHLAGRISDSTEEGDHAPADKASRGPVDYPVDPAKIFLRLSFPIREGYVKARLMIAPRENSAYAPCRLLVNLDYYTLEGSPSSWRAFGPSPQVSTNFLSENSINKVGEWLKECNNTHLACNNITKSARPARLLQIGHTADTKIPAVRLRVVKSKKEYKFVALSHYWANSKPIKTTPQNVHERLEYIRWDELPRVFQDTILLSIRLGIRYVWIDSLCIIQDDEADWLMESPKMGDIFGSAYLVFAAHGLDLALTKEVKKCTENVFVRPTINHDDFVNPPDHKDVWFGRAWCFQERLFGSRILHFGGPREEVVFECNSHLHCECGEMKYLSQNASDSMWTHQKALFTRTLEDSKRSNKGEHTEHLWRMYTSLCETFTSQGLTNPQDTLMALSSLADRISPNLGRYFAGLWEHNILIGLQWESLDGRGSNRHKSYLAPSFSWASRSGAVVWYISTYYLTPNFEECDFAQVLDINCETSPGAPHGRVTSGYIKIRGYATSMRFEDIDGCYSLGRLRIFRDGKGASDIRGKDKGKEFSYVCVDAVEDMLELRGKAVTCIDIMRDKRDGGYSSALILMPATDLPGAYRRVGFSTISKQLFRGSKLADITIL